MSAVASAVASAPLPKIDIFGIAAAALGLGGTPTINTGTTPPPAPEQPSYGGSGGGIGGGGFGGVRRGEDSTFLDVPPVEIDVLPALARARGGFVTRPKIVNYLNDAEEEELLLLAMNQFGMMDARQAKFNESEDEDLILFAMNHFGLLIEDDNA